jgi:hypothetical protein
MPNLSSRRSLTDIRNAKLERLRRLSFVLDNAIRIPGTRYRVGLDPLLGLIPGGGDTAGLFLSAFIVLEAAQMGASKSTLGLMAFNILLETLAGIFPGVGDLFDAAWKSNVRNIELLEQHLDLLQPRTARNRWFAILLIIGLVGVLIICAYLSFRLLQAVVQLLSNQ